MTGLQEAKSAARKEVLRRRDALPEPDRAARSRTIVRNVLDLPAYRSSGTILAYASFGSELLTEEFLRRVLEDGKVLFLPKVNQHEHRLSLYKVEDLARDLEPGVWGIREPRRGIGAPADPHDVDFVFVPGVAFDRRGGRLGYGGGFYDALISGELAERAYLVSGAFECQIVDEVPTDEHDAPVDLVVTEAARYPAPDVAPGAWKA